MDDDNIGALIEGTEIRIVDQAGNALPQGRTGLVQVKTRTMASGYWNDPALTASAFVDGWYHTNDAGFIPEPGKLIIHGRADDMLNIGGIKLPPGAIEDEIKTFPKVPDAVLLAQIGNIGEGRLIVAIELDAPDPPEGLRAAVAALVSRDVPTFDMLTFPSFPRTETRKVRKAELEAAVRRRSGP